ncbi:uncharacterized protein LOC110974253 [Acanthaster planci]|uniref:Uncharacterized protein LOC110974253 n=1 Tax=Acanthaster planci TaxID=133434 RepID=A0A8B7XN26_ACAPL|nr:uncharacterized protein LOC110974253 [Acanthaster planci]
MADISVRREARRRKLLQSSEERLQKIKQLNEKKQENFATGEPKEDSVLLAAITTPIASVNQAQSESAKEGDSITSTLPPECLQARRPHQTDVDRTTAESGDQTNNIPEFHATEEATSASVRKMFGEVEMDYEGDTEAVSSTASVAASQETSERNLKFPQESDHSPESTASVEDSDPDNCTSVAHSPHPAPSKPIPNSLLQNRSPPIPPFGNIPSSAAATSPLPSQPGTPVHVVRQDAHDPSVAADTRHFLTVREMCVVLLAILLRLSLNTDWFQSFIGQSVIIPFIALQVMFFCLSPQTQHPPSGLIVKLLSFAAVMSNIPQATIQKIQLAFSLANQFCQDLAFYLFAFILTHEIVEVLS